MKQTEILIQATGVFKCVVMILQIVKGRKKRSKENRENQSESNKEGYAVSQRSMFSRDHCEIEFEKVCVEEI